MKTSKANQRKGYQDSINIEEFRDKYRLNLARKHSRSCYGVEQKRISTGLTICQENFGAVEQMAWNIHYDILRDDFDTTLVKYGLVETPKLTVVESIKAKQLSVLEIYDKYCETKEGNVAETTLNLCFKGTYRNAIKEATEAVGEDALAIESYLKKNRQFTTAKECLRNLDKAYQLGVKHKFTLDNPFSDMAEKMKRVKSKKSNQENFDSDENDDDNRAFTIEEVNAIIEDFESSEYRKHFASIVKFLFWTGCRTGEAIGLKWRDIKWDKEVVAIRRTYNHSLKLFKPTKTGTIRFFPMPKDGRVWNLLKSIPEREQNDVVFLSKTGKVINSKSLFNVWHGSVRRQCTGVIPRLIAQGKVREYLKLYATRHTFISHQVNIYKIPITTVAQWVGNGAMVSNNSYLDRDRVTVPGYSDSSTQSPGSNEQDAPKQPVVEEDRLALAFAEIEALKAQLAEYRQQQ